MALQRQSFSRDKWEENMPKGDGKYFKIDLKYDKKTKTGEKIRLKFVPWVKNGKIVTAFPILIGWVKTKEGKAKPVRFELDEEIPDMDWQEQESKFNPGKIEKQTPKPAMVGLVFYRDAEGGGHAGICEITQTSISSSIFPKVDVNDTDSYIEDLENYDFVIHKKEERKFHVELFPKPTPMKSEHTEAVNKLLESSEDHTLSFDAYMNGEDPFGCGGAAIEDTGLYPMEEKEPTHIRIKKSSPTKESTKVETEDSIDSEKFNFNPDWADVVTGKGTQIGKATLDDLHTMRLTLKNKKKDTGPIWDAICSAIKDQTETLPPDEDDEVGF